MGKKYRDKECLRTKYSDEKWSGCEIDDHCNTGTTTIYTWLEKHGILKRSKSKAAENAASTDHDFYKNAKWLRHKYCVEKLTGPEIADECGCSFGTIYFWLDRHGISKRDTHDSRDRNRSTFHRNKEWLRKQWRELDKELQEIADMCDVTPSAIAYWIRKHEIKKKYNDPDWLYYWYVEKKLSGPSVALKAGCCNSTIYQRLILFGIESRSGRDMFTDDVNKK